MGTHLLRLALLLAALQYAAMLVAPTGTLMAELLGNSGRRMLKGYNGKYLARSEDPFSYYTAMEDGPPGWRSYFTIEMLSSTQVTIRASNDKYVQHGSGDNIYLSDTAGKWEKWTPIKNGDGSWSFTSDAKHGWLSAHRWNKHKEVVGGDENNGCERWRLESWEGSLVDELKTSGGRRVLQAHNGKYLTGSQFIGGDVVALKDGPPGDANHWTIEWLNPWVVTIKAPNGKYLRHNRGGILDLVDKADSWETWAPTKNKDGSWSFKTQWNPGWMSSLREDGQVTVGNNLLGCERWRISAWQPNVTAMNELLANGGRHLLKTRYGTYLAGRTDTTCQFCKSNAVFVTNGKPGNENHWTIERINDEEVALKASNGQYLRYNLLPLAADISLVDAATPDAIWTPMKHADGSFSFRSRRGLWLSVDSDTLFAYGAIIPKAKFRLESW